MAERTGLSTVRFYERAGLIADPVERVAKRRVFTEAHVEWLRLCAVLRASGMSLAAIRAYTELARGVGPSCALERGSGAARGSVTARCR